MTETVIHATSINPSGTYPVRSMGKPTPGYEFMIIDKETGELCVDGKVGELWVRGTRGIQLFLEYYDNPEAMAKSFTDDGWFKTGDMVSIGEGGNFFYSERDGDVLKVGGENVSAREVEDVCRQVPGIADIAVVGREHEMLDVVPVAFVIVGPGAAEEAELEKAIIELCAGEPRRLQGAACGLRRRGLPARHPRQGRQEPAPRHRERHAPPELIRQTPRRVETRVQWEPLDPQQTNTQRGIQMHGRIGTQAAGGDELLTTTEVAKRFRVNPKTVRRWALAGKITAIMTPGGQRRFSANEVTALLVAAEAPEGAATGNGGTGSSGSASPWLPPATRSDGGAT